MIVLMILYLLWETHFSFGSGTVDSRGIYKFQFIGIFDNVWADIRNQRLINQVTVNPLIDMPQISR